MNNLGKWTVIDIETTGIDPAYDKIIDIGFLQFEGTTLVRKYSSLVKTDLTLSKFIQKLTGIKQDQLKKAPSWSKVEIDFQELKGHHFIAHNSKFEEQFLKKYLEVLPGDDYFYDSIPFLALLHPDKSTLNLESFLIEMGIKDSEDHRGLEDSIDLLKVMLLATYNCHKNTAFSLFLKDRFREFSTQEFWFKEFFYLGEEELIEIAEQIDFDLFQAFQKLTELKKFNDDYQDLDPIKQEFSGDNIKNVLENEDRLKTFFEDYKFRASQEEMSLKVGQAFKNRIHSIIQAPTGTGKTLGYLLPSVLLAKSKGEQVLISTGTKTLQNQAVKKDIPQIHKIVGLDDNDLKVIRLYGSKNHLCELKLRNKNQEDLISQMQGFEETYAQVFIESYLFYNSNVVNYNDILTRENIPFALKRNLKPLNELQEEVAVDFRACTGNKCPFKNECTYLNGLKKSKEADLIIGNHALMLSWPRGMEKPRYIVIDEAHKMEGEVTNAYTLVLNQKELEQFSTNLPSMMGSLFYILRQLENEPEGQIKKIRNEVLGLASVIGDHKGPLQESIERSMKRLQNFTDIYWNEIPMVNKTTMNSALETSLYNHIDSLSFIFKSLYDLLTPYSVRWEPQELGDNESLLTAWSSFERLYSQVENAFTVLALLKDQKEDLVASIKYHEEFGYEFNVAPINVGELLYENVVKDSDSCVFTSATLANHDGTRGMASVEWMTGYKYIEAERRFKTALFLDNDFNYQDNVKVFLANNVPQIYSQDYVSEVMESLVKLIKDINGKTLLLFSARVRFERAIEIMLDKVDSEIPLFVQGMGQAVVENFKQAQNGILIGMESFGEGIDIPGDKLKLVYIDKIPDLRKDLIIDKRRDFYSREFGNEFVDYFLSHRTRSLHQKLGRLMRRSSDSGAVIITDPRISRWKKPTLDTFVHMMNPYHFEFEDLDLACSKAREFILGK